MAIEFRCTQCSKLLRTGDDTAGRQAKCPDCGAVMTIPAAAPPAAGSGPPPLSPPGDSPFAAGAGAPSQPPNPFAPAGAGWSPGPITPTILDLGDILTRTWTIFKEQWGMAVVVCLIVIVLEQAFSFFAGMAGGFVGAVSKNHVVHLASSVIAQLASALFQVWLHIGQAQYFLKVARGQTAEIGDVFTGGPHFVTIVLAGILYGLMVFFGMLALIVPGVILALMFSQYFYLIIDRRVSVLDSLSQSKELTNGNKGTLFLLGLVAMGIMMAGALACCVGVLAAAPFVALMYAVTYLAITGQPTAGQLKWRPTA